MPKFMAFEYEHFCFRDKETIKPPPHEKTYSTDFLIYEFSHNKVKKKKKKTICVAYNVFKLELEVNCNHISDFSW